MFSKIQIIIHCLVAAVIANGPIGYELFRNIDRIIEIPIGVQSKQFSSFDRKGLNDDFGNILRTLPNGRSVLAEHVGSGEVDSIWMTRDNGVFTKTGYIYIELDGVTVLSKNLQDVYDGKVGSPFLWPLVSNGDDTSGGGIIKVPMAYTKSMRITTDTNPIYYHVNYRLFSDASQIKQFNITDQATDVLQMLRSFGIESPLPIDLANLKREIREVSNINETTQTVIDIDKNSGNIMYIKFVLEQFVRSPSIIDDGRSFGKGGSSEFRANINQDNAGVRIIRRLDSNVLNQIASITVDGVVVGNWDSSNITDKDIWSDETIHIDKELTKNKTHITIKQKFISSSLDFNEFRYEIESLIGSEWTRSDVIDVGPNHPGEESTHEYKIMSQIWSGTKSFRYSVNQKKLEKSNDFLAKTRIRGTFDGYVTIDAPIGQFFGTGLGLYDTRSLWFSVDATTGMVQSFWPMPFGSSAKIELIFPNTSEIKSIFSEAICDLNEKYNNLLKNKTIGYFHATYQEETTRPGHDYIFLNRSGCNGIFYGVSHTMKGLIKTGIISNYIEGNERVFIDGKQTPQIYGTGTEDFYESGWFFRGGVTFNLPFNGMSGHEVHEYDCENDCTQAVRIYSAGIPFDSGIVFGIEHGPIDDNEPANYSSVAYWYGLPEARIKQTDMINVLDDKSRRDHNYKADGETVYQMSSSYEGENYHKILNSSVTTANKEISFKVSINSDNKGLRIVRTSDQKIAYQCVDVYVQGELVGRWLQPLGNQYSRYLDDTFDLPPTVSAAQTELTIKLIPVSHDSGPVLWSAISYQIMTFV